MGNRQNWSVDFAKCFHEKKKKKHPTTKDLHNNGRPFHCGRKLYLGSWENWQVCFEPFAVLQNCYSHSLFSLEQLVHFVHYTLFQLIFLSDCKEITISIISKLKIWQCLITFKKAIYVFSYAHIYKHWKCNLKGILSENKICMYVSIFVNDLFHNFIVLQLSSCPI